MDTLTEPVGVGTWTRPPSTASMMEMRTEANDDPPTAGDGASVRDPPLRTVPGSVSRRGWWVPDSSVTVIRHTKSAYTLVRFEK